MSVLDKFTDEPDDAPPASASNSVLDKFSDDAPAAPDRGFDATPARTSRARPRLPEDTPEPGFIGGLREGTRELTDAFVGAPLRAVGDMNELLLSAPASIARRISGAPDPEMAVPGPRMRDARALAAASGPGMAPDTGFRRLPSVENMESPGTEAALGAAQTLGPLAAAAFPGVLPAMGAAGLGSAAGDVAGDPTAESAGRATPHMIAAVAAMYHGMPKLGAVPPEALRPAAPEMPGAGPLDLETLAADNMGPLETSIQARRMGAESLVNRARESRISRAIRDAVENEDIYQIGRQLTNEETILQSIRDGSLRNTPIETDPLTELYDPVEPGRSPSRVAGDAVDIGAIDALEAPPRAIPRQTAASETTPVATPAESSQASAVLQSRARKSGSVVLESPEPVFPKDDLVPQDLTPRDKAEWWLRELDRRVIGESEKSFTPEDRALMWRVIDGSETTAERNFFNSRPDLQRVTGNIIKAVKEQHGAGHVTIGNRDPEFHPHVDFRGTTSLDRAVSHLDTAVDEVARGATKRPHLDQPRTGGTKGPHDAIAGFRSAMAESAFRKFMEQKKPGLVRRIGRVFGRTLLDKAVNLTPGGSLIRNIVKETKK